MPSVSGFGLRPDSVNIAHISADADFESILSRWILAKAIVNGRITIVEKEVKCNFYNKVEASDISKKIL